jgi:hypothetical protein
MTSKALQLKVKATRAWRELNGAALYTQYSEECDKRGLIDIYAVEECEMWIKKLKDIHEQQYELFFDHLYEAEDV